MTSLLEQQPYALPGTRRAAEIEHDTAQQDALSNLSDGFASTGIAAAGRMITQEGVPLADAVLPVPENAGTVERMVRAVPRAVVGALSIAGLRAGKADYDKDEKYSELTAGIPYEYHDDILENDNYLAAARARQRVQDDLARGKRMAQQEGKLAVLAGSFLDADLPLTFMSGGAYGSAKVARTALRASKLARLGPGTAARVSGAAMGANAGLQAGAIVGAVDSASRETTDWTTIANAALMSAALGTGVGGAMKGDLGVTIKAAQDEFHANIAKDHPGFREDLDVNQMQGENLAEYFKPPIEDGSVGAAQHMAIPTMQRAPTAGATPRNQSWISAAEEWRYVSGWEDRKIDADKDELWAKVAQHPLANLTTRDFNTLYKSKSAVANFLGGAVFESANGLGRGKATAAIRMENYHRRIQQHLGDNVVKDMWDFAKRTNQTWQGTGYHINRDGHAVFNREVMLEMNDRAMGRDRPRDPAVKRAADRYELAGEEARKIGTGRAGETAIDGFEAIQPRRGYTPQRWSGAAIRRLMKAGTVDEDMLVQGLSAAYRSAWGTMPKDADAVAKAVVHRALSKDAGLDMGIMSMMTGDGKDFMRESMVLAGMPAHQADQVIDRLAGAQHNRSKESFAKTRNDIDYEGVIPTKDGSDLRVVDILDNDMHGVWQRYTRQMSGSAALARVGIRNRAERTELIDALRAEQRALGEEPMPAERLEAMLSHFNGGPVEGYALGSKNTGIGLAALAKRVANLALLGKLGITQTAETGVQIARYGLATWMQRGPMAAFDKELKVGNKELLDDIAFITGEIGKDQWHFAPWLDMDDVADGDKFALLQGINKVTQVASFAQSYTSLFNHVRSFQQRTAALGVSDKVFRSLRDGMDDHTRLRMRDDLGLFEDDLTALEALIARGVIEFDTAGNHAFVNRLNMDQWPPEVAETFGSAIMRNVNQVVQKSLAGEQDVWMNTHVGSIMMHLKTFPMQAVQKQFLRTMRYRDGEALSAVLYGMATAGVAVMVRDAIEGRERGAADTALQAFQYSNLTGWLPTFTDPLMSMAGLDSARLNPYGPNHDWTPPTVKVLNNLTRAPGALTDVITGDADYQDMQAIKAIPMLNMYGMSRMFD